MLWVSCKPYEVAWLSIKATWGYKLNWTHAYEDSYYGWYSLFNYEGEAPPPKKYSAAEKKMKVLECPEMARFQIKKYAADAFADAAADIILQ